MGTKTKIPKWLKRTQTNSWEPEVFLSGIVLFGLIQLPEYLEEFRFYFRREVFAASGDVFFWVALVNTGIQWLTLGLILHLFCRGVWIGMIGLSYVFPQGINLDRLHYKDPFKSKVSRGKTATELIIRLEKICSSIYSFSYYIFMSLIGWLIFTCVVLFAPLFVYFVYINPDIDGIGNASIFIKVYVYGMQGLMVLYFVDFLSMGQLRKWSITSRVYYYVYVMISVLTFNFLYRNIYYTFITNLKRWQVISGMAGFIIVTLLMIIQNLNPSPLGWELSQIELFSFSDYNTNPESYDQYGHKTHFKIASIQNDIITGNTIRLFITHQLAFEDSIKKNCDYRELNTKHETDSLMIDCLSDFYQIYVDDSLYSQQSLLFYNDLLSGHRGVLTYLDVTHLKKGMHEVRINLKNYRFPTYDVIQFYRELSEPNDP